jgi:hypothetical protein
MDEIDIRRIESSLFDVKVNIFQLKNQKKCCLYHPSTLFFFIFCVFYFFEYQK